MSLYICQIYSYDSCTNIHERYAILLEVIQGATITWSGKPKRTLDSS